MQDPSTIVQMDEVAERAWGRRFSRSPAVDALVHRLEGPTRLTLEGFRLWRDHHPSVAVSTLAHALTDGALADTWAPRVIGVEAAAFNDIGLLHQAEGLQLHLLGRADGEGDHVAVAGCFNDLGVTSERAGRVDEALERYASAIALARLGAGFAPVAQTRELAAIEALATANIHSLADRHARRLPRPMPDLVGLYVRARQAWPDVAAAVLAWEVVKLDAVGRADEAVRLARRLPHPSSMTDDGSLVVVARALAAVRERAGRTDDAIRVWESALDRTSGEDRDECARRLAALLAAHGDPERAFLLELERSRTEPRAPETLASTREALDAYERTLRAL